MVNSLFQLQLSLIETVAVVPTRHIMYTRMWNVKSDRKAIDHSAYTGDRQSTRSPNQVDINSCPHLRRSAAAAAIAGHPISRLCPAGRRRQVTSR